MPLPGRPWSPPPTWPFGLNRRFTHDLPEVPAVISVFRRLVRTSCGESPILQDAVCRGLGVAFRRTGSLLWVGGVRSPGHPCLVTGTSITAILNGAYAYRPDREGG